MHRVDAGVRVASDLTPRKNGPPGDMAGGSVLALTLPPGEHLMPNLRAAAAAESIDVHVAAPPALATPADV